MISLLLIASPLLAQEGDGDIDGADIIADIDPSSQQNSPESPINTLSQNQPPQQPAIAAGPVSIPPAVSCYYRAYAIDQDGDPLIYIFQWDDGNCSTVGPVESGIHATVDHIWYRPGRYQVTVKAMDANSSSPWSSPLVVSVNSPPGQPSIPSGRSSALPEENASFSASSEDPDEDRLRYTFDWGDGSSSSTDWTESGAEMSMVHCWERAGIYEIRARAEDERGASSSWSPSLTVEINSPPGQPSLSSGRSSALPKENASFSASSEDPDGDRLRYTFDWGDGFSSRTDWTESSVEMSMVHCWERAGIYEIQARAEDERGSSSPWSERESIIINTLPTRPDQLSGPISGYAMVPYHFQTSAIDEDGDPLNYTFDWGDGRTDAIDLVGSGHIASFDHTWNRPGSYQIRAMAADRMGGEWSEERRIAIASNEQPDQPRDLYGLRSGYTGIVCNFFTMARDPDGDKVMHVLDWGDGTAIKTGLVLSGSLENASHVWMQPGEYPVRVLSLDEKGAPSLWSGPFMVAINANYPPEQPTVPSGPAEGQCLISHGYATSAIDPDGDAVKYVFDWGDGTTSWTGLEYLDSGEESSVSHKWMQPGIYQIKAAAMDDKGSISDWSGALAVKIE